MINHKVITNQIFVIENAARAKDKNAQILHKFRTLKGPLELFELWRSQGKLYM